MRNALATWADRIAGSRDRTRRSWRMPTSIKCLFAADLLLVLLHLFGPPVPQWENRVGDQEYLWDLSAEGNLPTWYASAQLAILAVLLLAFAALRHGHRAREAWVLGLVGVGFLVLSLDEQIGIHERLSPTLEDLVGDRSGTSLEVTGPWMLVAAPLFLGGLAMAAYLGRDLLRGRPRIALLYLLGTFCFTASFAGFELLRNFVGGAYVAAIEETGEMLGITLLVWATLELMRSHRVRVIVAAGSGAPDPASRARPRDPGG